MFKFVLIGVAAAAAFFAYKRYTRKPTYAEMAQDWASTSVEAVRDAASGAASSAAHLAGKARETVGV